MDSKQLNTLDPKLKETYERVMGTSSQPNVSQPITQKPTTQSQPLQPQPFQPIKPQPIQQPIQTSKATPFQTQPTQTQPIQGPQTKSIKKTNKMLPILLVLTGIVFLIGYTIIWLKIFNLNLPFLPF